MNPERKNPKRTISASDELGSLQHNYNKDKYLKSIETKNSKRNQIELEA